MDTTDDTSVTHAFAAVAAQAPARPALIYPDAQYSYAQLKDLTSSFALRMAQAGIDSDAVVRLDMRDTLSALAGILATSLLGASVAARTVSDAVSGAYPVTHILTDSVDAQDPRCVTPDSSYSPASFSRAQKDAVWSTLPACEANKPWMLVTTSGTTGLPKLVGLSQPLVQARSRAVFDEFAPASKVALLFHASSRPFFARSMAALCGGASLVISSDAAFLRATGVTRVSGSREACLKLVTQVAATREGAPQDGTAKNEMRFDTMEIVGAKLTDGDVDRLLSASDCVDETYGATETSKSHATLYRRASDGTLIREGRCIGAVFRCVDPDGQDVAAGENGEILVRSDTLCGPYLFDSSTATSQDLGQNAKQAQDSGTPRARNGWYAPGDIGHITSDGRLVISGRARDDVMSYQGRKINFGFIEMAAAKTQGVATCVAFESPKEDRDEIILFVVFEEDVNRPQVMERAKLAVRQLWGAGCPPVRAWPADAIPMDAHGQPDRARCRDKILQAAQLHSVGTP